MTVGRIIRAVGFACCAVAFGLTAYAFDIVYPAGANLLVDYQYSDTIFSVTDTLTVTRTFVNNENFPVSGVYFSDWFPSSFRLARHTTRHNGTVIAATLSTDASGLISPNMTGYYWVLDPPGGSPGTDVLIQPDDTITLTLKLLCNTPGTYQLPMHTLVCHADNEGGFFATDSPRQIHVRISTDVEPGGTLPAGYLLSTAYPNPFNATVAITYEGRGLESAPIRLTIYNAMGQEVHSERVISEGESGTLHWIPDAAAGTGVYFYRLSSRGLTASGKLVLLK